MVFVGQTVDHPEPAKLLGKALDDGLLGARIITMSLMRRDDLCSIFNRLTTAQLRVAAGIQVDISRAAQLLHTGLSKEGACACWPFRRSSPGFSRTAGGEVRSA